MLCPKCGYRHEAKCCPNCGFNNSVEPESNELESKIKYRHSNILIYFCFAFSFLIVPLIVAIILCIDNNKIDKANKETFKKQLEKQNDKLDQLKNLISVEQNSYNSLINKKETIVNQYRQQAEDEAKQSMETMLKDSREKVAKLQQEIETKELLINEKNAEYDKSCKSIESNAKKVDKLKEIYKSFQYAIKAYDSDSGSRLNEALLETADENLAPIIEMKLNCMNVKQLKTKYNQLQRDIQDAFKRYEGRYTTKANTAIYKLMVIALEAELQNVLTSLKYGKLEDSIDAVKAITSRYLSISVDGNQNIAPTMKKFIGEIEYLFIEAVKVEYEYYMQKQRIKEEQQALKEQMRQEAAERKALEEERKKVEKEEAKYKNQISAVEEQIAESDDDEQIKKLQERIAQLQEQMDSVKEKKDKIAQLQNGKAGFVYVISNLGSFGDHVFKIGMTRRQDPMDRIKELGDASVPFSFDVHSFIFSDDAVNLETTLHHELNSKRVNKINMRKEFFDVSIDELEELVYKYEPTAEFNRTMLAEQYRQGLSLDEELVEISEDELVNV